MVLLLFLSEKVPRTARRYGDRMAHRPFLFLSFPLLLHPSIQPYKLLALIQFWDYASWDDGGKKGNKISKIYIHPLLRIMYICIYVILHCLYFFGGKSLGV